MQIPDDFHDIRPSLSSPLLGGFDITPDDGTDLPRVTRALMVTAAGDVAITFKSGDTLTLPGLTPGVVYPVRAGRVLATGTTATGLKGLV